MMAAMRRTQMTSTVHQLVVGSPTDIRVDELTVEDGIGISFRTKDFASDKEVICFIGSPADLKATFSRALDLLDRKLAG